MSEVLIFHNLQNFDTNMYPCSRSFTHKIHGKAKNYSCQLFNNIYKTFVENEIGVKNLVNSSEKTSDYLNRWIKNYDYLPTE